MDDDPALDFGLDPNGEKAVGWVARHFDGDKCGDGKCLLQKYLTSFYWAIMTMTTVRPRSLLRHCEGRLWVCRPATILVSDLTLASVMVQLLCR